MNKRVWLSVSMSLSCLVGLGACAAGPEEPEEIASASEAVCACISPTLDTSRSLFVTDAAALAQFSFQSVLDRIVSTASVGAQSSLSLYQQWWDLNNDAAHAQTTGPHCDDQQAMINGFPVECPRRQPGSAPDRVRRELHRHGHARYVQRGTEQRAGDRERLRRTGPGERGARE